MADAVSARAEVVEATDLPGRAGEPATAAPGDEARSPDGVSVADGVVSGAAQPAVKMAASSPARASDAARPCIRR